MRRLVFCFCLMGLTGSLGLVPAMLCSAALPGPVVPPPVPPVQLKTTPIEQFRQLLALSPVERERQLAAKSADRREFLLRKLREYDALSPSERESRLQNIQLRLYLQPLLTLSAAERSRQLAQLPASDRQVIQERLQLWDLLPAPLQKEVLANEWMLQYILRFDSDPLVSGRPITAPPTLSQAQAIEAKLEQWRALPRDRRQRISEHFYNFFQLPPAEKAKVLEALSDAERKKLEYALRVFEQLPPDQRKQYIDSFRQLANMTAAERSAFLLKAEHWRALSAQQRNTWRALVTQMPPLPPGLAPAPPLPPGLTAPASVPSSNSPPPVP